MKLVVGMPVFQRAWCLPIWFDCLEAQDLFPKEEIALCFAYSEGNDNTYEIIKERGQEYGDLRIYEYDLPKFPHREDTTRFTTLATLRNALLSMVREVEPEYFLSWDNDIIFPPSILKTLFETPPGSPEEYAVGALMDMGGRDSSMRHPSVMHFPDTSGEVAYRRPWESYPQTEMFACDIIMAVKLMTKEVYKNTEYRWDVVGEDIGWCHSVAEKGYPRYLQPKARGLHLYDQAIATKILGAGKTYPAVYDDLLYWWAPEHAAL